MSRLFSGQISWSKFTYILTKVFVFGVCFLLFWCQYYKTFFFVTRTSKMVCSWQTFLVKFNICKKWECLLNWTHHDNQLSNITELSNIIKIFTKTYSTDCSMWYIGLAFCWVLLCWFTYTECFVRWLPCVACHYAAIITLIIAIMMSLWWELLIFFDPL